ncbi:oocyte zinc finger protein XlCOF6-like [Clytia hemisphaerica]
MDVKEDSKTHPFTCDVCQKQFKKKYNLQVHTRSHTDERPYICKFCKATFRQLTHMKNHIRNVHQKEGIQPKKDDFGCTRCGQRFPSFWRVITHSLAMHKNPTVPLLCMFCQDNFALDSGLLIKHCRKEHKKEIKILETFQEHLLWRNQGYLQMFGCNLCNKEFATFLYIFEHLENEHGLKAAESTSSPRFQCIFECQKEFSDETQLVKHFIKGHWPEGCSTCISCGKSFDNIIMAKKHFKLLRCQTLRDRLQSIGIDLTKVETYEKVGEKTEQCPECDFVCTRKSTMEIHARTHRKEKFYECPICRKKFSHIGNMKKHITIIHEGKSPKKNIEKLLSCHHCDKMFESPSLLERHLITHTGEKPYTCQNCGKTYTTQGNLTIHSKACRGIPNASDRQPTINLKRTINADSSQNIKFVNFTLEAHNREPAIPNPGGMFSKFKTNQNNDVNSKEPEEVISEDELGNAMQILKDSDRLEYMNLEFLTAQYFPATEDSQIESSNITNVYGEAASTIPDCSQSVIIKNITETIEESGNDSHQHQLEEFQKVVCSTITANIHDQTYLDKTQDLNVGTFNMEYFFQDQTMDERYLNVCQPQNQEEVTTTTDLLLVPDTCWWQPSSTSPTKNTTMATSNNNNIPFNNKSFPQTVIKNITGGEIKDVETLSV